MATTEAIVNQCLDLIIQSETLEESFAGFVLQWDESEVHTIKTYEESMRSLVQQLTATDKLEVGLRQYIDICGNIVSHKQNETLLQMLEFAVTNNLIPAKLVCETILSSEKFHYKNEVFWCNSLSLIRKVIGSVDYKGVRDLLKILFDRVNQIPAKTNVSVLKQLISLYSVFDYIFNRNHCLLPAYLILDEIQKKGKCTHWKFAKLITSFIDSFRPTAQMVSTAGRSKLLPIVGHSSSLNNIWKLDPVTAKFQMRGLLPYNKDLLEPQIGLLRYVLEQPSSRDMITSMLALNSKQKQRNILLEEQLVELIIIAMERSESCGTGGVGGAADLEVTDENGEQGCNPLFFLWQHLSSHLIYFVLFQFASFPHIVLRLHDKLSAKNPQNFPRKSREHLMWILLQFISGSIKKNPLQDFLPIMKLYDLLYHEREALPVPDVSKSSATHSMSASSIWIHLMKKAETDAVSLQRPIPLALKAHIDFLQENLMNNSNLLISGSDYRVALLCNAYSTNQELFARPLSVLVDGVQGGSNRSMAPGSSPMVSSLPTTPLSISILDSLTLHTKMSLIHSIANQIMKLAQTKSSISLAPALVETYSRLLIYTEIESLGIKGFMTDLLNTVWRSQAWGIFHTLLEMYIYRLHHINAHYRIQLLGNLHSLSNVPQTNHVQLHLCMENTALKLIQGLSSTEVLSIPQYSRFQNEPKSLLSTESEELNKVLVLTLARAIHVTGSETLAAQWLKEILTNINQSTSINWSSFTLLCFPNAISEFYQQVPVQKENKAQLRISVEEEYRKWKSMSNENDGSAQLKHFSLPGTPPLFLCLLWKMLLESDRINPIVYKILDRIGARALSTHMRTFADFLVYEFANLVGGQHVNKFIDALNDLIWKYYVITIDRLILCLALRSFEGNEAQVCFFIIHMLLLRPQEFKNRVYEFVKENSPEHWKQSNWHEKHMAFNRKYPEKFYFECLQEVNSQNSQHQYLPFYFSNVCLRFLPVFDIVIHRFLELPSGSMSNIVDQLLDQLGCLYKFHDKPITYLYNTLHYYETKLKDKPLFKRKLVSAVITSFKDIRPKNWALSEAYLNYMQRDDVDWNPGLDYYIQLIGRVVETISGQKNSFPHTDYRFNEFPNASAHALHVTCVELMALPVSPAVVANSLLDVVLIGHKILTRNNIEMWMNAIGVILTALSESYLSVLNDRILEMMESPLLMEANDSPFDLMDFQNSHQEMNEMQCSYLIALTHAVWHNANVGQISLMPQFLKDRVKPVIKTEEQFIFICHIVGPFLQRFFAERTRCVMDVTIELYDMLEIIDKNCDKLRFIDPICDLLYHIKYMFTGDTVKNEVEATIRKLRPNLQMRLRFITHINLDEVSVPS
ncbi:mediator of RNA polymerase II transcription subunit 23-like [Oppia nitens]|uniref:mediator of RNA polymerase II transcription subunit 23-like n=1 Tax=Oppia nitens TaxID=1686743 RepID=UPI0023DCA348|nr:mediator of RNA polymerase II transcription subunit 23-like [Oppia nitens]